MHIHVLLFIGFAALFALLSLVYVMVTLINELRGERDYNSHTDFDSD